MQKKKKSGATSHCHRASSGALTEISGVYGSREKHVTAFTDMTGQRTHAHYLLSSGCRHSIDI